MKKFIVIAVVLALLVPSLAMAATEFSLGGFIKLDAFWDSDNQVGKNITSPPARSNDPNAKHGRLRFTAQGSRFNFTIKGPDLWGAKTSGFIEMDFDSSTERPMAGALANSWTTSNSYIPRLRHAMFRFNWPTSELLFGHYWSMFCEYYAESAEDGPLQMTGTPTARLAQIRFTQTFRDFTVAALIGDANNSTLGLNSTVPSLYNVNVNNGQSAETPQVQGKIAYAHDFWGKAAYYGKPTPFTIQFVGGWQRSVLRGGNPALAFAGTAFGEQNLSGFVPTNPINVQNTYVNPWMAMGSLFIPVIPTQSANLAGTASILTQWWIGQGVEAFGIAGVTSNLYRYQSNWFGNANYDVALLKKFGGFVQGQYYFSNQWFLNALYGVSKTMGVSRSRYVQGGMSPVGLPIGAQETAFVTGDNASTIQQAEATLWYRPIQAIKFGLQYSYVAASYGQMFTTPPGGAVTGPNANNASSRFGDDHRVQFVGFFYF